MKCSKAAAAVISLLGVFAALAGPAIGASTHAQIGMLMRLHELPPGYMLGDEGIGCGRIDPEGTEPPLANFLARHLPKVCEVRYERIYPVSGQGADPPLVFGAVIDLRTAATARRAEKMLPALIERVTGSRKPIEETHSPKVGAETRLFFGDTLVAGHVRPAGLVTWRQGGLIGLAMVGGEAAAPGEREATRMAQRQRAHMLRPTPYPAKERDDVVVPLENPAITLPIYWLGRSFDPGGGAKPLRLTSAYGPLLEGEAPPGTKLELWYDQGALQLGTWTTESWQLYRHEKLGRELLDWPCTKTTQIPVAGGSATLYAGYDKNFSRCPGKAPDVFAAVVEVGGVVLGMGLPTCYTCLGGGPDRAELEAAVGDLRLFHPQG